MTHNTSFRSAKDIQKMADEAGTNGTRQADHSFGPIWRDLPEDQRDRLLKRFLSHVKDGHTVILKTPDRRIQFKAKKGRFLGLGLWSWWTELRHHWGRNYHALLPFETFNPETGEALIQGRACFYCQWEEIG